MTQRTQDGSSSTWGSNRLSSRVAALLAAARHGPFAVQAKKAVKMLEAPTTHVRCSGLRKLQQLVLQFSHLHKERQVALELLLLSLEHGTLSGTDADVSHSATIATVFSREQQLPCAAFLQPPAAAAAAIQPAAAVAAIATDNIIRLTCRSEALGCLIELIAKGALGAQQLIDALHSRLAAAGNTNSKDILSNSSSSSSCGELLPPQLQLMLMQRMVELALQDKLLPQPLQQPQGEAQEQHQQPARLQQGAAVLHDALVRIYHFCPRVCLAAVEAVSCVLEAACTNSCNSENEAPQNALSFSFEMLLEPTLVVSMQLLLNSSSSSAGSCSLIPLAVTRLLRCADLIGRAELQYVASQEQHQGNTKRDKLLHFSLSALLRIEDVEEFCCCFAAALQSAKLSDACIAALQQQRNGKADGLLLIQLQQQQARVDRLLWECLCRLYTAREQRRDLTSLLQQLLHCLELFLPLSVDAAAADVAASGSSNSSSYGRAASSCCLSVGLWRVTCATVGWLLWSAAPSEANSAETFLLLLAVCRMLQLQPRLLTPRRSTTPTCSGCTACCFYRKEALRLICCMSPLLLLLIPLVTQQQLGAGGRRCDSQLTETLQEVTVRTHALLSCAAAAVAAAAASEAAAEGEDICCSEACCFAFDVEELFGLTGALGQSSSAAAAMPLSLAVWAFRVLDWGAAQQLLGRERLAAAERRCLKQNQDQRADAAAFGQQQTLLRVLLRRKRCSDLHSPAFLLSVPSALLQQGPYAFLVACCFMAEGVYDRQQAFAAVSTLVATAPAAALQLLPALHFAALRPPMAPILRALLHQKACQKELEQQPQQHQQPLLPDNLILFDGDEPLAAKALAAAGAPAASTPVYLLPGANGKRWQLLRSLSRAFALSLQALASLGVHKTAVLPAYRALHNLLPLQPQQQENNKLAHPLSLPEDEWFRTAIGTAGPTEARPLLCCHRLCLTNDDGAHAACSSCYCCSKCCWCKGDSLALLASRLRPVAPHVLLSANGRWFLLMRSLSRLAAFDELPYTKLAAAAPATDAQLAEQTDGHQAVVAAVSTAGEGRGGAPQDPVASEKWSLSAAGSSTACVSFVLPTNASPLQQLLLAFCLQRLEAVCPRALLQFLPAMQQLVASCGPDPSLQQQHGRQQQQWLVDRACGLTLSTLGRLCMRRFLESAKILRVLRRKCAFLFNTLRAPAPALDGYVLILYALAQDLAEQIEEEQQEQKQQEQPQKRTDSGLSSELEAQVQEQLLMLEEVAEASSSFARSVALRAASLILGPLYAASAEMAAGSTLRTPAGEGTSVRFACSEGIGGVVLHLPLRQLEVRGAAALLAAAMTRERMARGGAHAQTPAELLRQQQQQKLGSFLSRNASAAASETAGEAQSERALLRLLLLSKPRTSGATGGGAQEARELKELRAHTQQEVRDIARHFVTSEPLLLMLLPKLCEFFVRRFVALLPVSVAADGELLRLGQQILQQLEVLLPRSAVDDSNAAAASAIPSADFLPVDRSTSTGSSGLGMRLPEFSVLASVLSALATQQPALTPAVLNFFSLRLHASVGAPPPPWLSSCLLLALAPLATSADVSTLWVEPQEGQDGEAVFAAILQGTWGFSSPSISSRDVQNCLCGAVDKVANDHLATARCIFLSAHALHYSGDRVRLGCCLRALLAAAAPLENPSHMPTPAAPGTDEETPAIVTAGLAIAIAEVARIVHLQAPDPRPFYPQLLEAYKNLAKVVASFSSVPSSRWNALIALGSLLAILLEAGFMPLDEAIYFMQGLEELLEQLEPEPSTLAYAGLGHLTHSLLPLLLLLQRRRKPQRVLRVQQQIAELQRLLLHFEGKVQRWLSAPAVGAAAQLSRAIAAGALMGCPFLLMPPTQAAAAQRSAGASGLTSVSFALGEAEQMTSTAGDQQRQQPNKLQHLKQQDASAAVIECLMDWFSGKAPSASFITFGGQPSRVPGSRVSDLAGTMLLSLLYVELTSHTTEGSLASLPEKSLTRLALQELLQIRDGQELLLPELTHRAGTCGLGAAAGAMQPTATVPTERDPSFSEATMPEGQVDQDTSEVAEAFGGMGLVASRTSQKGGSGGSGLPVPHCTCLLEALAYRGVPAFSELQLGKRLALLFARSLEITTAVLAEVSSSSRSGTRERIHAPAHGGIGAVAEGKACSGSSLLLQQLQAWCSLQVGLMRFCCRHCDRLPQLAGLLVEFAHAGFGIGTAPQQQRKQQRQRRFTAAVAYYFFALLPTAAGALSPRAFSSLLGGILLRGLLPPAQEPILWCSALNALRRILDSVRLGVCCSGRDTKQRKRWEHEQQQQQQRRRRSPQIENETPCYIFSSVSHKLCLFREIQQLIMLWILPLLTNTDACGESQQPAESTQASSAPATLTASIHPSATTVAAAAAAAAREVPFAVWGVTAEAIVSYLLLRKDCLLLQDVVNEGDVASLPTADLQNRRRQHFARKQRQEEQQLMEELSLLPAIVVVYIVLSGAAPLELIHRKRTMLVMQPAAPTGSSPAILSPVESTTAGLTKAKDVTLPAVAESKMNDGSAWEDDLVAEVAALSYACSWLPHKEQVELLEAFAYSSSGGNENARDLGGSALRCFVGFVVLAAHMVAPHQIALFLPNITETDTLTAGSNRSNTTSGNSGNLAADAVGRSIRSLAGDNQGCPSQWVASNGSGGLSLCGEFAAFPSACADVVEHEDSIYAQVSEPQFMYTSQQGIKHLISLHHLWNCYTRGCHQCCCCSCCSTGSAHSLRQLVVGAADTEASSVGLCLEPLLLAPAAFAGARRFYCLSFVPNLYYLSSLSSQPIQSRVSAVEKVPTAPAASGNASNSISSKPDAASLCNELVAEHEKSTRFQKKAVYGDECHEEILLERRDAVLLQAHLPSVLLAPDMPCASRSDLIAHSCPGSHVAAKTLVALAEALAPTVVRLLHAQARCSDNTSPAGAVLSGCGRPGPSLPERLRLLGTRLQRLLAERQFAR